MLAHTLASAVVVSFSVLLHHLKVFVHILLKRTTSTYEYVLEEERNLCEDTLTSLRTKKSRQLYLYFCVTRIINININININQHLQHLLLHGNKPVEQRPVEMQTIANWD